MTDTSGKNMMRMTRAELHRLVWSKPMTELARLYGVRDQHVAQACDAHDIARPRAGHWQRVEHGKTVETAALDNTNYSPEAIIIIEPSVGRPGRVTRGQTMRHLKDVRHDPLKADAGIAAGK
ncbi:hypothetical protein [Mesorhizobium amorphae]|uniref:hypothetical protein n=1 Tax=Mesorhizobium amorphae TaxID=71433 RepID=UPI00080B503C|nr:hypothetical protein [Mesorhizobium amorphae]